MKAHEFCVYGYSDENTLRVNTLNSSGQSTVIYFDNNILIARPLCQNRTNMSPQAEINRRKDAIALYQQHLPEFTPKTELAIFQGEHIETKTTFPILGRFTTKFENVIPLTKLTDNQVVNNPYICESLAKISLFSLGMFLTQGKIVDPGRCGTFGCSLPPLFAKIARTLVTDNTMISTNKQTHDLTVGVLGKLQT